MHLESVKWWHWSLIGLAVGALLSLSRLMWHPEPPHDSSPAGWFDTQVLFTRDYFDQTHPTDEQKKKRAEARANEKDPKAREAMAEEDRRRAYRDFNFRGQYVDHLVIHPPDREALADATVYHVEVKDEGRQVTLEVSPTGSVASEAGPRLPVYWEDVEVGKLPEKVRAAVKEAVGQRFPRATVESASKGPRELYYVISARVFQPVPEVDEKDKNNPRAAPKFKKWEPALVVYRAKAPYTPEVRDRGTYSERDYNFVKNDYPGAEISPTWNRARASRASFPTVMAYLDELKAKYPKLGLGYQYAWWEEPRWVWTFWTGGSWLAIGLVWPVVLGLLQGAGFGRAPKESYDLSRFKGQRPPSAAATATAGPHAREMAKLLALEAELEARLRGSEIDQPAPPPGGAVVRPARPPTPVPLSAGPAEARAAVASPAAKAAKAFGTDGGDYYPTEIHGKDKLGEAGVADEAARDARQG